MIYPSIFPKENQNQGEKIVFEKLSQLSGKYDIFYARRFLSLTNTERPEYEIDFIVCENAEAIICIEVKGGIIRYDGVTGKWYQNSQLLIPGPDMQASSAAHSLVKRYPEIGKKLPVGWALCFPECQAPYDSPLPPTVNYNIIDQNSLIYIDSSLDSIFQELKSRYPNKTGCRNWEYENFKNDLLRGLGFVQLLGTRFKLDEERYIQLADQQISLFHHIIENKKILVYGPAGSGKTIIAKTIAQELASNGERILFLCFNRTLGNRLAYETGIRNNPNITTGTFHSFAKRFIEDVDSDWWQKTDRTNEGFWDIELPVKLDNILNDLDRLLYDCVIIDEGQDFSEFWFEILFKLLSSKGRVIVFLDKMQDIFSRQSTIPNEENFFKFRLEKNCRNSRKIVKYLEEIVSESIETENTPEGDEVEKTSFKNEVELQTNLVSVIKTLLTEQRISCDQILIILNSDKKDSSIAQLSKIGKHEIRSLDNKARFENNTIHYTTIEMFKGLEADVVFIIDVQKIPNDLLKIKLYTEASRAKHKLFLYEVKS